MMSIAHTSIKSIKRNKKVISFLFSQRVLPPIAYMLISLADTRKIGYFWWLQFLKDKYLWSYICFVLFRNLVSTASFALEDSLKIFNGLFNSDIHIEKWPIVKIKDPQMENVDSLFLGLSVSGLALGQSLFRVKFVTKFELFRTSKVIS